MSADRFTIAPARAGDAEAVLALYRAASRTPGSSWNDDYPDRSFVAGDIARGSLYCLWGEDGALWGAASCGEPDEDIQTLPCWTPAKRPFELCRIGILPEMQGRGLAGELLRWLLEEAPRRGVDSIRLLVSRDNPPALALYRRFGFSTVGTCRLYGTDWFCQERILRRAGEKP